MTAADIAALRALMDNLPPGGWKFEQLRCDDNRGMGYVSVDGIDVLHSGERSLWKTQNLAIGELSAAALNALPALLSLAEDAARMRAALVDIAEGNTSNDEYDEDWMKMVVELQKIACAALAPPEGK